MPTRPSLRHLGVILALGCAAVGCSDDDAADEERASTSTTVTTAAPASSTTRPAAPLSVVVGQQGILGWWDGGQWVQAKAGEPTPLPVGADVTLVRLEGPLSHATVGDGAPGPSEFCGAPQVDLDPDFPLPEGGVEHLDPIGVHGVEDPQPRPVAKLDPAAAVYREAAAQVLADLGIEDPAPEVVQVVRADLSGDGTDEVLVVAERLAIPATFEGRPGDYSVLFLRQVVDGEVRTTVVEHHIKEPADELDQSPYILVYRVSAIADLNGDGAMEVVVEEGYYEGSATTVRALGTDGALEEVVAAGCGV